MSDASPERTTGSEAIGDGGAEVASLVGTSPYATGGGGVTFERKVAARYLAHLLAGDGASELGDGRSVVSVEFQRSPDHPVDDLVVSAACPEESLPSLVLALAVRRSPNLIPSDESTRKLIRQFVRAVIDAPKEEPEHRLGLIVAGPQPHARQLADLADLASVQMDSSGFANIVRTPGKFDAKVRGRLDQLEKLVGRALKDLGVAAADPALVQQRTWELLALLTVSMPRLESSDETDWAAVANSLVAVARGSDPMAAAGLRDRLVTLASEYSPKSARVDLKLLRRDTHALLDSTRRRHQRGWQALDHLHESAISSVRDEIITSDGARRVRLNRETEAKELLAKVANAAAVVVSGESGVGKSALAVRSLMASETVNSEEVQALSINLRHLPKLTVQFEDTLGCPLSTLLGELSAPQRMLIVDGADAVAESMEPALRYLVDAAQKSDVKVLAVTSVDSRQLVRDTFTERFATDVAEHVVAPLTDTEIDQIVQTFTELRNLRANPRSRELLGRLIVVHLLVRAGVRGVPLTDADAMRAVWSRLVRRREGSDRGSPQSRESALLRLADLNLSGGDRLDVIAQIDSAALDGLHRDGLLRTSDHGFTIGPEFTHEEVRRYAIARLLLSDRAPAKKIKLAGAPRWPLSAAQLACQELLAEPDAATTPLRGRFAALQASFDALVDAGHGARWGDVPGEALLALADPRPVLRDAWSELLANGGAGLRRLARLIVQRYRNDIGIVDVIVVEPIVTLLLEDKAPWKYGEHAQDLLRDWLRGLVAAKSGAGHRLRIVLRQRIVEACVVADRRFAAKQAAAAAARAARSPEELERERLFIESQRLPFIENRYGRRRRKKRPEIPREITDDIVLELLALLGPDLGNEGEQILRRVARDAPLSIAPAIEELFTGNALAHYRPGFLSELTQAYYLDEEADGSRYYDYGIRCHRARSVGAVPLAAWYRGPFMPLFQSDFRNGVAVLNRLLNHAARTRARPDPMAPPVEDDSLGSSQIELEITGKRQRFVGDRHVWLWYRGTGVGPSPCSSALQALERVCDRLIEIGTPIGTVVAILLDGCENLAMVSLVLGLLVRHLENTDDLLDSYLVEPLIWEFEFARVVAEHHGYAADSKGLVASERRKWSLREAAALMVMNSDKERATELRTLGETLVANARRHIESTRDNEPTEPDGEAGDSTEQRIAQVRAWASSLDRDRYQVHESQDGLYVQATPPENIVRALEPGNRDLERAQDATRLIVRYYFERKEERAQPIGSDELTADLAIAQELLEDPPSLGAHDPMDTSALVSTVALEAHLLQGAELPRDDLSFAVETVLRIGESETRGEPDDFAYTLFEQGADRSAARALPLLLLPGAARLRAVVDNADGWTTFERASRAGAKLARAVAYEVRLHLARGMDHVWKTPCAEDGPCHHKVGWRIATETLRDCVLGRWNRATGRRSVITLKEPFTQSLSETDGGSILPYRLDAAIRALAPAAVDNICVSACATDLLAVLLAAQQRSLASHEHDDADHRGAHTLVSARALLTVAEHDDVAICEHLDAFADNSALLGNLLRALSPAAEETPRRAATARRTWPNVVRHVLALNDSGHSPFQDRYHGDMTLAALMPTSAIKTSYLYHEVLDAPIAWWEPLKMQPEIEAWLTAASGRAFCVDRLIGLLHVLAPEDRVRTGLPWVSALVLADPAHAAGHSFALPVWLTEIRTTAVEVGRLADWQEVVDALVVAGVTQLAPYSE